ncbi:winged helix-turn-helix transcriptional regulator [Pantoea piersonii]|jgi:DNA-binding HxlR family transcriptional regulator|uniref:Helix-turn-helix transcriptional regulator n=1 Tax=Pantoea piersonii TaxID=2364647 RepID=A0AAJ5QMC7_9GAMM|nr:helix-turn-helix domain-containing protein [Pantoea piersonii]MBZ6387470.1 helix-turn-helix transcriptional regulator [Pantoea piersonii]MBZ6400738.1 helix-turn-helix transcriptional regulator [Pantoea piersonii]MBZ6408894.1 helix-turn-helix transcriptional regulator [Pantoea piersonii]MBZ6427077.1 helix-turn-helix transcriptional regulator [Pantoea piersonii]NYB04368.1 helix-turn-helix transcriptional regulator [Pantoea piersonii]
MNLEREAALQFSKEICEQLSDDDDGLKREILTHTGNRWSLGVVHILGTNGPMRHADIRRRLNGVTQRMLTRTLRQLERDGLIARFDYQEKRPRVEYSVTELGKEMLIQMMPVWRWIITSAEHFRKARAEYDLTTASTTP